MVFLVPSNATRQTPASSPRAPPSRQSRDSSLEISRDTTAACVLQAAIHHHKPAVWPKPLAWWSGQEVAFSWTRPSLHAKRVAVVSILGPVGVASWPQLNASEAAARHMHASGATLLSGMSPAIMEGRQEPERGAGQT